jgi:hypothetical protein
MSSLRITYTSHSDTSHDAETVVLANIYKLVLDRASKEAAPESRPDDAMKGSKNDRAKTIIQESR